MDKPLPEWIGQDADAYMETIHVGARSPQAQAGYERKIREGFLSGARRVLERMEAQNEQYRIALAAIYNRLPPSGDYSKPQIVSGMLYDISSLAFNALKSSKEKP